MRWLRAHVWSFAAGGLVVLILLTVLIFPKLLRPDLSGSQRVRLEQQGVDKLVEAENDRSNAQNDIRTTLLQGIAGLALVTGAYFAFRGLQDGRRQLEATREGQITTRFTEAVKQLGDEDHLAVRIGGIYSLERIARDSDRDAPTVVALLSAFVRSHTGDVAPEQRADASIPLSDRAADVQIALTVLTGFHDLANADLRNADLRGADLKFAELGRAKLGHADLTGADLKEVDLTYADLTDASVGSADLTGANLRHARLRGADLTDAKLGLADLTGADFTNAIVHGADLAGADGADLTNTRGTPRFLPGGSRSAPEPEGPAGR